MSRWDTVEKLLYTIIVPDAFRSTFLLPSDSSETFSFPSNTRGVYGKYTSVVVVAIVAVPTIETIAGDDLSVTVTVAPETAILTATASPTSATPTIPHKTQRARLRPPPRRGIRTTSGSLFSSSISTSSRESSLYRYERGGTGISRTDRRPPGGVTSLTIFFVIVLCIIPHLKNANTENCSYHNFFPSSYNATNAASAERN